MKRRGRPCWVHVPSDMLLDNYCRAYRVVEEQRGQVELVRVPEPPPLPPRAKRAPAPKRRR